MAAKFHDDEYVANLLKQDAKNATKKYELVGIDAFNPKRAKSGAPKPNTGFLRHLIRQTDSHNAALLAKEAEESNARLKLMNREKERERRREEDRKQKKAEGRLTPVLSDDEAHHKRPQRRNDYSRGDKRRDERERNKHRGDSRDARSERHKDKEAGPQRLKRRREDSNEDRTVRKRGRPRSHHDREGRHRHSSVEDDDRSRAGNRTDRRHRRRRSYSRSTSRSRSRSSRSDKDARRHRHRDRSRSPGLDQETSKSRRHISNSSSALRKSTRCSMSQGSDSDPLEALVGPLPPPAPPVVRSRGRGAHKANAMGIESRFSSTYDPSIDVHPNSDAEDDWGDAVEAFRDRQRWKQQGAERLKAAGFTDSQVKKWEKGGEQNEEDVVWASKGQAREWDRGKAIDGDGDVELKADFGRLK
ncbi:Nn.00g037630.m01.CDS01 [Neocucurbitaria sp. VM-36]